MGFAKPTVSAATPSKKNGKERSVETVAGLQEIAAIDAIMTALKTHRDTLATKVKEDVLDRMVKAGAKSGTVPGNPDLVEGDAKSNFQLKARASNQPIDDEDAIELLTKANIPLEVVTVVPSYLAVNPIYQDNQDLLARVDGLLEGQENIPEDFIIQTVSQTKTIVGSGSIASVFAWKDADVIGRLLPYVSVSALGKTAMPLAKALHKAGPILAELLADDKKEARDVLRTQLEASIKGDK